MLASSTIVPGSEAVDRLATLSRRSFQIDLTCKNREGQVHNPSPPPDGPLWEGQDLRRALPFLHATASGSYAQVGRGYGQGLYVVHLRSAHGDQPRRLRRRLVEGMFYRHAASCLTSVAQSGLINMFLLCA